MQVNIPRGIDPRYKIVLGAGLTQFTVIGCLFAYGLFFKALETEFGWSRTLLSSSTSAAFLMMGILAIAAGRLNDRINPRWILAIAGILYGLGYIFLGQINEAWQLVAVYCIFVGIGLSTHDVVALSTIASWFEKRRGMMTGVVKTGTAIGQMLVPPFAAMLIAILGWRQALEVLGVLSILVLIIAALLMKKRPQDGGGSVGAASAKLGFEYSQARRTRQFWTLCCAQFLFFPSLVTIPLHIAVHGEDLGMDKTEAAILLSVIGFCSIIGRLTIGTSVDRIGGRNAYILCFLPLIASLIAFLFISSPTILFLAVALYGFGHGGFFTVVSPTVAEYFGMRAHGSIFGIIVFCGTIGAAVGPMFAGWVFDVTGSYDLAFGCLAGLASLGLALTVMLKSPESKQAVS